jgi:hypothetical protein
MLTACPQKGRLFSKQLAASQKRFPDAQPPSFSGLRRSKLRLYTGCYSDYPHFILQFFHQFLRYFRRRAFQKLRVLRLLRDVQLLDRLQIPAHG